MPLVEKNALVLHSAELMFDLVTDVAAYPGFVPWCSNTIIHEQLSESMLATMEINFKGIKQSFTTMNTYEGKSKVFLTLKDGPFKRLRGCWEFISLEENACKIIFSLEYEFSNMILGKLLGPVFGHIANTMVDVFVKRADELHG